MLQHAYTVTLHAENLQGSRHSGAKWPDGCFVYKPSNRKVTSQTYSLSMAKSSDLTRSELIINLECDWRKLRGSDQIRVAFSANGPNWKPIVHGKVQFFWNGKLQELMPVGKTEVASNYAFLLSSA